MFVLAQFEGCWQKITEFWHGFCEVQNSLQAWGRRLSANFEVLRGDGAGDPGFENSIAGLVTQCRHGDPIARTTFHSISSLTFMKRTLSSLGPLPSHGLIPPYGANGPPPNQPVDQPVDRPMYPPGGSAGYGQVGAGIPPAGYLPAPDPRLGQRMFAPPAPAVAFPRPADVWSGLNPWNPVYNGCPPFYPEMRVPVVNSRPYLDNGVLYPIWQSGPDTDRSLEPVRRRANSGALAPLSSSMTLADPAPLAPASLPVLVAQTVPVHRPVRVSSVDCRIDRPTVTQTSEVPLGQVPPLFQFPDDVLNRLCVEVAESLEKEQAAGFHPYSTYDTRSPDGYTLLPDRSTIEITRKLQALSLTSSRIHSAMEKAWQKVRTGAGFLVGPLHELLSIKTSDEDNLTNISTQATEICGSHRFLPTINLVPKIRTSKPIDVPNPIVVENVFSGIFAATGWQEMEISILDPEFEFLEKKSVRFGESHVPLFLNQLQDQMNRREQPGAISLKIRTELYRYNLGAVTVEDFLPEAQSLVQFKKLSLVNLTFGKTFARALAAKLREPNCSLKSLTLYFCKMSGADLRSIIHALTVNNSVTEFRFHCCNDPVSTNEFEASVNDFIELYKTNLTIENFGLRYSERTWRNNIFPGILAFRSFTSFEFDYYPTSDLTLLSTLQFSTRSPGIRHMAIYCDRFVNGSADAIREAIETGLLPPYLCLLFYSDKMAEVGKIIKALEMDTKLRWLSLPELAPDITRVRMLLTRLRGRSAPLTLEFGAIAPGYDPRDVLEILQKLHNANPKIEIRNLRISIRDRMQKFMLH